MFMVGKAHRTVYLLGTRINADLHGDYAVEAFLFLALS
jgi:hypothetical protein